VLVVCGWSSPHETFKAIRPSSHLINSTKGCRKFPLVNIAVEDEHRSVKEKSTFPEHQNLFGGKNWDSGKFYDDIVEGHVGGYSDASFWELHFLVWSGIFGILRQRIETFITPELGNHFREKGRSPPIVFECVTESDWASTDLGILYLFKKQPSTFGIHQSCSIQIGGISGFSCLFHCLAEIFGLPLHGAPLTVSKIGKDSREDRYQNRIDGTPPIGRRFATALVAFVFYIFGCWLSIHLVSRGHSRLGRTIAWLAIGAFSAADVLVCLTGFSWSWRWPW